MLSVFFFYFLKVLGVALVLLFCYSTVLLVQNKYRLRKFPGPPVYPIVGSLLDNGFLAAALKYFRKTSYKYGKVYAIYMFHNPRIVVCDAGITKHMLINAEKFPKGSDYKQKLGHAFGNGLVTSDGEIWRKHKKILSAFFQFTKTIQSRAFSLRTHKLHD